MSSTHNTAQHESMLHEFLETADPQARLQESEFRDCPECQEQLKQLIQLRAMLDQAGIEITTGMEDAKSTASPLPAGHVQKTLGSQGPTQRAGRPQLPWIIALVATAAALLMYFQPQQDTSSNPFGDTTIMGEESQVVSASAEKIEWVMDRAPTASYVITLRERGGSERILHTSAIIRGECKYNIDPSTVSWEGVSKFYWEIAVSTQRVDDPSRFIRSDVLQR